MALLKELFLHWVRRALLHAASDASARTRITHAQ